MEKVHANENSIMTDNSRMQKQLLTNEDNEMCGTQKVLVIILVICLVEFH